MEWWLNGARENRLEKRQITAPIWFVSTWTGEVVWLRQRRGVVTYFELLYWSEMEPGFQRS